LKNIALEAGKILMKYFRSDFEIKNKEGSELLTTADKESEEFIISAVNTEYPDIEIIAEETKPESSKVKEAFIIDPLDGTNNFSYGIPVFSISLAYQSDGNLKIGVVYDPVHKEIFYTEKGEKAFLNDSVISVSKRNKLNDSILATGFPYIKKTEKDSNIPEFSSLLMKARGIRRLGSAALDLCYVACGRLDGYWEKGLKIWDLSAGGLIVEQAGGKVTNFSGNKWDYMSDNIIASNGLIHSEIQKTIKKI
ncbi:MAG: inositol monophosphatase family protein, partial [candidate division WOR-3 bacterium]